MVMYIIKTKTTKTMEEIEIHELHKRDSETIAEICLDYLSEKGIYPEIWSFELKCFLESEMEK